MSEDKKIDRRNYLKPCRMENGETIPHLWIYDEGYDEHFCPFCDRWYLINGCDDEDCYFNCTRRPLYPSEMEDFFDLVREKVDKLNRIFKEDYPDEP